MNTKTAAHRAADYRPSERDSAILFEDHTSRLTILSDSIDFATGERVSMCSRFASVIPDGWKEQPEPLAA